VDVLESSSKITMKLNFQPFRTKIHYGLIQNQLDILGLVKKLLKLWFFYANIKKLKKIFFATCLKQQLPFFGSQGFWYSNFSNLWWLLCGGIKMIMMENNRIHIFYKYGQQQNLRNARLVFKWLNIFYLK
jgi:hypothetical protein